MNPANSVSRRRFALAAIALLVAIAIGSASFGHLIWPELSSRLDDIRLWAASNPTASLLIYLIGFSAMTLLCLPVGPISAVLGGVLFGAAGGTAAAIGAAIVGGVALFLVARRFVGRWLPDRYPSLLDRLRRDGFLAILALRIASVTPGWLVSLAAGSAGINLAIFSLASTIGILPAFTLFARLGAGMGDSLLRGQPPTLDVLLRPMELLPLLGLAALIGLPILIRAWRAR